MFNERNKKKLISLKVWDVLSHRRNWFEKQRRNMERLYLLTPNVHHQFSPSPLQILIKVILYKNQAIWSYWCSFWKCSAKIRLYWTNARRISLNIPKRVRDIQCSEESLSTARNGRSWSPEEAKSITSEVLKTNNRQLYSMIKCR